MKENKKHMIRWRSFTVFSCTIGLLVGIFSVISDNLPCFGEKITMIEFVVSYLAVMINSLPVWFSLAMVAGFLFAGELKGSVIVGVIYTLAAITFYFVISNFYGSNTVTSSFVERVLMYLVWYIVSAVGGLLGGSAGFLLKKNHYTILILTIGLMVQIIKNGESSWNNMVGIAQNTTYCLMLVSTIIYLIIQGKRHSLYMQS
ncbi:hypothetical protein JF544_01290 [Halobacillus kuroshimensis]|uniref:ECF transporter S component n=1 Tax=Halobacillus kuroshimensis TaxID=302481 RepID=A0ABS3DR79_9BACI|nr:hypothetical protein [Halobacillus kuroshimensis]MBN8233855.1 hypothetical protein [Halobacillus kuroshimensis]